MTSSLHSIQHASLAIQQGFIAATIFGCDLGPNLTTVGSLATILWLLILRQRNIEVSGLDYFKVGILVTPLMLIAGGLTLPPLRKRSHMKEGQNKRSFNARPSGTPT